MKPDDNELLNFELTCGKWTAVQQQEILKFLKEFNSQEEFYDEMPD